MKIAIALFSTLIAFCATLSATETAPGTLLASEITIGSGRDESIEAFARKLSQAAVVPVVLSQDVPTRSMTYSLGKLTLRQHLDALTRTMDVWWELTDAPVPCITISGTKNVVYTVNPNIGGAQWLLLIETIEKLFGRRVVTSNEVVGIIVCNFPPSAARACDEYIGAFLKRVGSRGD